MDQGAADRTYWVKMLCRIGMPVFESLCNRELRARMPVEAKDPEDRRQCTYLEALGRLLSGMAPWLELQQAGGEEEELRVRFASMAREALDAATDPASPDFMNFSDGGQPIVDAAFLAHAIVRAPRSLWLSLEPRVQRNVVSALKATRTRKPAFCNWLLFSAMIETALEAMGEADWDPMRIDYALKQHEQWYLGDGTYGDGPQFHWDYYNSFVIQPMLVDILGALGDRYGDWTAMLEAVNIRAVRQAEIQERLISPEGTFPPLGRSLAYRCGAFQSLAQMSLREQLPAAVAPPQVRCALTAVMRRTLDVPGTFDENGWLRIGLSGSQPAIGESYISTGSLYLCTAAFLPLGLAADRPFWRGSAEWTSKRAWSGMSFPIDQALSSQ